MSFDASNGDINARLQLKLPESELTPKFSPKHDYFLAVLLAREEAVATVWRSYTSAKASIQRKQSADDLLKASQSSYDSLMASFNLGRTQIQDVLNARTSLAQAMATKAECDQSIAASLATLAYSSGQL